MLTGIKSPPPEVGQKERDAVKEQCRREQQVSKLLETCEDIDSEGLGTISSQILAKILRGVAGVRVEIAQGNDLGTSRNMGSSSSLSESSPMIRNGSQSSYGAFFTNQQSPMIRIHGKEKVTDGGKGWNGTVHWLETYGGSSIPGKVNYRHFFKNVNIFDNNYKPSNQYTSPKIPMKITVSHSKLNTINLDDFRRNTMETKKYNLEVSDPDMLKHYTQKNDILIEDGLEHFYRKNAFDYPEYQYKGRGELPNLNEYKVKDEEQVIVLGHKNMKYPGPHTASPGIDIKNRSSYIKARYQGNANLVGKINNVKNVMDLWKNHQQKQKEFKNYDLDLHQKISELLGHLRDKVPTLDIRRLHNLRTFMLIQSRSMQNLGITPQIGQGSLISPDFLTVPKTAKNIAKIESILGDEGHGVMKKIIIDFLEDVSKHNLSIHKLDQLIKRLEESNVQAIQRDKRNIIQEKPMGVKARDRLKHPMNQDWQKLSHIMSYLQGVFELKFKRGLREAFLFFDENGNGLLSEQEFIKGLQKLGQNCVTIDEAKMVFKYLDSDQQGEIGSEQFKDIIHEERPPKNMNQLPERFPDRLAGLTYNQGENVNIPQIKQLEIGRNETQNLVNNWKTESQNYGSMKAAIMTDDKLLVSKELATFYKHKDKLKHSQTIALSKFNITPSYGKKKPPHQADNLIDAQSLLESQKELGKFNTEVIQERNSMQPPSNFKRFTHNILQREHDFRTIQTLNNNSSDHGSFVKGEATDQLRKSPLPKMPKYKKSKLKIINTAIPTFFPN